MFITSIVTVLRVHTKTDRIAPKIGHHKPYAKMADILIFFSLHSN